MGWFGTDESHVGLEMIIVGAINPGHDCTARVRVEEGGGNDVVDDSGRRRR